MAPRISHMAYWYLSPLLLHLHYHTFVLFIIFNVYFCFVVEWHLLTNAAAYLDYMTTGDLWVAENFWTILSANSFVPLYFNESLVLSLLHLIFFLPPFDLASILSTTSFTNILRSGSS